MQTLANAASIPPAPQAGSLTDTQPLSAILLFSASIPEIMRDIMELTQYGVKNCPLYSLPSSRAMNKSPMKSWSGFDSSPSTISANIFRRQSISF